MKLFLIGKDFGKYIILCKKLEIKLKEIFVVKFFEFYISNIFWQLMFISNRIQLIVYVISLLDL